MFVKVTLTFLAVASRMVLLLVLTTSWIILLSVISFASDLFFEGEISFWTMCPSPLFSAVVARTAEVASYFIKIRF
jgi:hypothetical protein